MWTPSITRNCNSPVLIFRNSSGRFIVWNWHFGVENILKGFVCKCSQNPISCAPRGFMPSLTPKKFVLSANRGQPICLRYCGISLLELKWGICPKRRTKGNWPVGTQQTASSASSVDLKYVWGVFEIYPSKLRLTCRNTLWHFSFTFLRPYLM